MTAPPYSGSCLCGAIRFQARQFLPKAAHCHCSMCRKFHGAAFATFASVSRQDFRWLSGEATLKVFTASNGTKRSFCSECGSSLTFFSPRAPEDIVEVSLAAFDDPVPVEPDAHIFVASGVSWALKTSTLPAFQTGRASERI